MIDVAKRLTTITVMMSLFAYLFLAMLNAHDPAQRLRHDVQTAMTSSAPAV